MGESHRKRNPKRIGIITPVYNEAESLPLYERRVRDVLVGSREYDVHVLLVDDGSTDGSWRIIEEICRRDGAFRGIRLSRNFGPHRALTAGLLHIEGDAVATLACDLQDPPGVILDFIRSWEAGAKIVWGHRRTRCDPLFRRLASRLFEGLLRRFAMPHGSRFCTGSFLLLDARVVECFRQFRESNRITFALVAWTGFDQAVVEYDRVGRVAGKSGWTARKMMQSMYDAFVGFSMLPVRLITFAGLGTFLLAMTLGVYVVVCWFIGTMVPGWASIVFTTTFFFGIAFFILGVMGEYLSRIYAEVVGRPLYFISETTGERDGPHPHACE